MRPASRMAMAVLCLLLLARILVGPSAGGRPPASMEPAGSISTGPETSGMEATGVAPEARMEPRRGGPDAVASYSTEIAEGIRTGRDVQAVAVADRIAATLPPGWEHTFVLHDCLVAAGSLEEISNLLTHSDILKETLGHEVGLTDADRAFVDWLGEFAATWLGRKHPALGEGTILQILRSRPRAESIPELGRYDILSPEDRQRIMDAIGPTPGQGP